LTAKANARRFATEVQMQIKFAKLITIARLANVLVLTPKARLDSGMRANQAMSLGRMTHLISGAHLAGFQKPG
jgi:hypothetical protein